MLRTLLRRIGPRLGLAIAAVGVSALAGALAQPASLGASSWGIQSPIVGPPIDIHIDPLHDNYAPVAAYDSLHDEYLVVWVTEQGMYTRDIVAQRVDSQGNLVDPWFTVATAAGETRESPVVVYNPVHDEYLVVYVNWYNYHDPGATPPDIFAKRVSWNGGSISPELPIAVAPDDQVSPSVAYNSIDDEYLVVYSNQWADGLIDLYAQRVRGSDGGLVDWRTVASDSGTARQLPSVAYSPTANAGAGGYLITYNCHNTTTSVEDIRGKVAHGDLNDLYLGPEIQLCASAHNQWDSAVAYGRQEYLAIWWEYTGGADFQLRGRRVGNDGAPLGNPAGFGLSAIYSAVSPERPRLAHGFGYLGIWRQETAGPSTYDIYGILVPDGQDSPSGGQFAVDDSPSSAVYFPSLACAPSGDCLVVYSWSNSGNYDVRGRFVKPHRIYLPLVLRNW